MPPIEYIISRRRSSSRTSNKSGRSTPTCPSETSSLKRNASQDETEWSPQLMKSRSFSIKPSYERYYRDLEEIGRGRFAHVKKCWSVRESKEVAVKFFRRLNDDAVRREFSTHAPLSHRNIVSAWDLYKARSGYALIMEL
jgi:hypothetical protein